MTEASEAARLFFVACAQLCPHCAVGNPARHRPETGEFVHDYAPRSGPSDTPALAAQGGPARMLPGTFAHVYCLATTLRLSRLHGERRPENAANE